jgi:hypothetical protein
MLMLHEIPGLLKTTMAEVLRAMKALGIRGRKVDPYNRMFSAADVARIRAFLAPADEPRGERPGRDDGWPRLTLEQKREVAEVSRNHFQKKGRTS